MEVIETIEEVRKAVRAARAAGKTVGFVPTMGALHAGHASLIDAARSACGFVVVSIFVNPTQFGPNEDFSRYPRTPEADQALCEAHGASAIFMPSAAEMYPAGAPLTEVHMNKLGDGLCGASRPGHFTGVCTVVAKLFNIVCPDKAFFGAKDFQQAAIIRRMAADLNFGLEVVVCPTVREADGLAMSSRNTYLSPEHRKQAVALSQALKAAKEMILAARPPASQVAAAVTGHIQRHAPDGVIDYVQVVEPRGLLAVEDTGGAVCIALAVKFGATRLIDNIVVDAATPKV